MRPLIFLCALLPLAGQTAAERGKKVIDEALAALGGEKFLAMRDRVEAGRGYAFSREQLSGLARLKIYSRYLTRPEPPQSGFVGLRERQAQGKDEEGLITFTEGECWETTYRGARPMAGEQVQRWRESLLRNILYILRQRLGEPGLEFRRLGSEVFENQPAEVVEIADNDGRVVNVWFHASTKLPLKQSWVRRDPQTRQKIEEVTVFAKFRDVGGGVQWPWVIRRERNGEKIFEMFSELVVINQGLLDDMFTISEGTKVLPRKK
jgi:hypothetical protein